MRIGVPKSDRHDGQIPIGSREDQIVLDGTDGSSSNAGESHTIRGKHQNGRR